MALFKNKITDLHHLVDRRLSPQEAEIVALALIGMFKEIDIVRGEKEKELEWSFLVSQKETEVIIWSVPVKSCDLIVELLQRFIETPLTKTEQIKLIKSKLR